MTIGNRAERSQAANLSEVDAEMGISPPLVFPPVEIAWVPPRELSPNARVHRMVLARAKRDAMHTVWGAVMFVGWPPQPLVGPRRRLTITVRKKRLMDMDNLWASLKAVIDAVRLTGALVDDSPLWVEVVVRQEKGAPMLRLEMEEIA